MCTALEIGNGQSTHNTLDCFFPPRPAPMANVVLYKEGLLTREEADSDDYLSYVTSFCLQYV
jgi:hypothetical protein